MMGPSSKFTFKSSTSTCWFPQGPLVVVEDTGSREVTRESLPPWPFVISFLKQNEYIIIINQYREKSILKKESVKNPLIISENVCRAKKRLEFLHGDHVTKYDIKGRIHIDPRNYLIVFGFLRCFKRSACGQPLFFSFKRVGDSNLNWQ